MAEYRYHLYDLASGVRIDTLPLEQVTYSREMRGVGSLRGQLPMYGDGLTAARVLQATIPDHTKIFVERDNALVWGGRLVPPRSYDSASGMLSVTAEETIGAFASRYLPTLSFLGADQFDIARALLSTPQADSGGNMGVGATAGLSGVLRDRNYNAADQTVVLTALTELSEVENGFEFATQTVWSGGAPAETVLLGYPRLGRAGADSGLVLEYDAFGGGGNIVSYTWDDGPGLFTRSWASTETDEGVQLTASATNSALLGQGYPLLEQSQQFDGITNLATLQAHANALSAFAGGHHVTAKVTVMAQPGVEVGDWQLGDEALVRISDWRFPPDPGAGTPGYAGYMRIMEVQVTPGAEGDEQYDFTMGDMLESL
ncbi:hypothetical protein [Actinomadura violacea]|uniref:Minor tail protein n=1 Tax=Actinomadura violacea TaxID=2819934 RepID=A0ABS3RY31_9ACTN|nr:hypothetical protein [Actinomadura violacea]MBO2461662.1 hypothetical protein [Actinomadura violacea]